MQNAILVLAEHLRGEVADITFEMLGIGRKVADAVKAPVIAVAVGKDTSRIASQLGTADTVLTVDNPKLDMPSPDEMAGLLQSLIERKNASLVMVPGTNLSIGIGPKLSFRSKLPFVNFCRNIRLDGGSIIFTSQLFSGKIFSDVRFLGNRGIVSIYPGSFPANEGRSEKKPPLEHVDFAVGETKVAFKQYIEPEAGDIDITKQDFLVSVGRGIETADNIAMADELAQLLGGAVCASRPVVDQGWLPMSRQVGKSGMTVKPKLYLALGISGAPEHVEGMKGSDLIISINKDANAPIFNVSHYGVCANVFDVLPPLIEKIKAHKGDNI